MTTAPTLAPRHSTRAVAEISVTATGLVAAPTSGTALDERTLSAWAARIDADGIEAHEDLARTIVTAASRLGLCPVLVDVLADPAEPTAARERAFGRLALSLTLTR